MSLTGNTYLVRGDDAALPQLTALLGDNGIRLEGNSDAYVRSYAHFGIDEARDLSARAYGKSMQGGRRIFVSIFPVITNEAQNALLKTLEEPPSDALFFLVTPAPATLLPTLRSRAHMIELTLNTEVIIDMKKFLKSKPRERIDMLKPLLEKNDDDRRDIGAIITFLSSLERTLSTTHARGGFDNAHREGIDAVHREGIESVYRARMYVGDKGSLLKPLLEQVALLVPML